MKKEKVRIVKSELEDLANHKHDHHNWARNDSPTRLLQALYNGYVNNRLKEMDRIDHSTGWSMSIFFLVVSYMLATNVHYYIAPLALIIIIPYWMKESRRYVYYMFWSKKESDTESLIKKMMCDGRLDPREFARVVDFKKPTHVVSITKAIRVRFYRTYYWLFVLDYVVMLILAVQQGAISNPTILGTVLLGGGAILLAILSLTSKGEIVLPRRVIMLPGIVHDPSKRVEHPEP